MALATCAIDSLHASWVNPPVMIVAFLLAETLADGVMARYVAMTAAERPCVRNEQSTDITICGRRDADRFRVPFLTRDPGDRSIVDVPLERAQLIRRRSPIEELGPFLVGGGMVGVHFSTRTDLGTGETREPAP